MPEMQTRRGARYWVDDEGIVHGTETSGASLELNDAVEAMAVIRKLAEGRRIGLLMDITNLSSMARDVRAYFSDSVHTDLLAGVALIVKSHLSRAIGNFFIGFNRSAVRTRLFTDEQEALGWLRSLTRTDGQ